MEPGFTQHALYSFAIFHPISSPSKPVVIAPTQEKSKSTCATSYTWLLCFCSAVLKTFTVDNRVQRRHKWLKNPFLQLSSLHSIFHTSCMNPLLLTWQEKYFLSGDTHDILNLCLHYLTSLLLHQHIYITTSHLLSPKARYLLTVSFT